MAEFSHSRTLGAAIVSEMGDLEASRVRETCSSPAHLVGPPFPMPKRLRWTQQPSIKESTPETDTQWGASERTVWMRDRQRDSQGDLLTDGNVDEYALVPITSYITNETEIGRFGKARPDGTGRTPPPTPDPETPTLGLVIPYSVKARRFWARLAGLPVHHTA
ncbi:uncharacterized protein P884DRAFT_313414, partial [Thermothelomyces heterothallicus CBS 202.75]|uniref:uncharacterized protein n=1 Tax=Thermothelomyces heterothallicus CBS 202.75 TaxID=1149848 RepID=UPI00374481B6